MEERNPVYYSKDWPAAQVPVVCISGVKNSGKTTFLLHLLEIFEKRGIRAGVIKHDAHGFDPDVPGTDSYRIRQAGASAVGIFSNDLEMTIVASTVPEKQRLAQMVDAFSRMDVDLILIEGGKFSPYPKIELLRKSVSAYPVCDPALLLAVAADWNRGVPGDIAIDDYDRAADLILSLGGERADYEGSI